MDITIIFEDDYLMVINKPAGLVVDPSNTQETGTLVDLLKEKHKINLERSGIVHRLDKDTSGVLIVAKTQEALENLQAQFKNRVVKKEYLALVHGEFKEEKTVNGAIARNPGNREKFIVWEDEDSKEAETKFVPVKCLEMTDQEMEKIFQGFSKIQMRKLFTIHYSLFTLVACRPKTGRTHQIRVHLKYIGFPIVADEKYGGRKIVRLDKRWCPRLFLHASGIEFAHPASGRLMEFKSPLPEDLNQALNNLND